MPRSSRTALRRALPVALVGIAIAPATLLASHDVNCLGTEAVCTANVNLAGGASNDKVTVELPGTQLKLRATTPAPSSLKGAFSATGGTYTTGGSVYQFTLNAVGSITSGYASMTFTNPQRPQGGVPGMVKCLGDDNVCTANISLKGGASNKLVKVQLPGTDLKLSRGAKAVVPATNKGAYGMSGGKYTTGGSIYQFSLNAVESIGKGSWLALTFRSAG
ncbi:MAG: hypothetical protein FJW99_07535 [Actinobacteria bacterium]|nr:hypothetical protein [Actinomycetota bacterium]